MPLAAAVVIIVALTVMFTLFVSPRNLPPPEDVSPTRHLDERKAAIYENLRDLQFEYRVGKLSDQDYQRTKLGLQKELAQVLAEMDKLAPAASATPAPAPTPQPAQTSKSSNVCPHCGAKFPRPMKFCGECGKAMA